MLLFGSYPFLSVRVPTAGELLVMARDLYEETFGPPEDVRHVRPTQKFIYLFIFSFSEN